MAHDIISAECREDSDCPHGAICNNNNLCAGRL